MQDRFKFRVWYKSFGEIIPKMLYDAEQTYDYMYGEPETIPANSFGSVLDNKDEYIVMQSTGLKDKNGKLIYEGDIVNVKIDGLNKSYIPKVVVWDRKEWQLKQYNKNFKQNCSACEVKTKQKCQYCSQYFSTSGHTNFKEFYNNEVIGNIYENKELLNDMENN